MTALIGVLIGVLVLLGLGVYAGVAGLVYRAYMNWTGKRCGSGHRYCTHDFEAAMLGVFWPLSPACLMGYGIYRIGERSTHLDLHPRRTKREAEHKALLADIDRLEQECRVGDYRHIPPYRGLAASRRGYTLDEIREGKPSQDLYRARARALEGVAE